MKRLLAAAACALALTGCSGSPTGGGAAPPSPASHPSPPPTMSPERFARSFASNHRLLRHAIARWVHAGARLSSPLRVPVAQRALAEQSAYRELVARPRFARRVLARLPRSLRVTAGPIVEAQRRLSSLTVPVKGTANLETRAPEPPRRLLRYYRSAQRRFGVPWAVLAAVNFVESKFGRILGPSTSGARGPMQFMPSTWSQYGAGGDVDDPRDAIMGAARYLAASGAPRRTRAALLAYNPAEAYADAVLTYARDIAADRRNFYDFYFWQVFVLTKHGVVRLTGPGAGAEG